MAVDRRAFGLGLLAGATTVSAKAQDRAWSMPDDPGIQKILAQRIDAEKAGVGIVVGVIDAHGRRILSHGARAKGDLAPLNGETIFEIGSMTKVFTSLLLAIAVEKGEVALADPVEKYLPPGVRVPQRGGRQITLLDLATHTSGLPRLPTNFTSKDPANPYADYTPEMLWAFLKDYRLTRDVGATYEYSNIGAGLLGQALCRRAGLDYATLVERRITGPLGMASTTVGLTPALRARLAQGHNRRLQPVGGWDIPTFAGAGALHSDAHDILTFLAAELGLRPTPLQSAMAAQLVPRRPGPAANVQVALAWHITRTPAGQELVWHNGGTGGYRTFMGFDRTAKVGVVVLSNVANDVGGDDIGFHLLAGAPLAHPAPAPLERTAIRLSAEALEPLVGSYALTPQILITITREADQLYAQVSGQPRFAIYPETKDDFFWKVVDAQATFLRGADGRASGLVLHQAGRDLKAARTGS